jgi:hypothetical protein
MVRWIRWHRRRREPDPVSEPREADRDTGEDEYESHEEEAREAGPSGMTRVKTDNV